MSTSEAKLEDEGAGKSPDTDEGSRDGGANSGERVARWLWVRVKPLMEQKPELLATDDKMDENVRRARNLNALGQWIGRGFVLLIVILTFFSIKDGELDRIITEQARPAFWVFLMVGGGVVLSYVSATLNAKFASPTWFTVAACTVLGLITGVLLKNLNDPEVGLSIEFRRLTDFLFVGLFIAGTLLAVVSFIADWRMPLPVSVLLVAVFATVVGLYGVAKLAVVSKGLPDHLKVRAATQHTSQGDVIQVRVLGRNQPADGTGTIRISGVRYRTDSREETSRRIIGSAAFAQDRTTNIQETFTFPVTLTDWDSFVIDECAGERCGPVKGEDEVARIPGQRIAAPADLSGEILANPGRALTFSVQGHGVAPGTGARIRITRGPGERVLVTTAWAIGDAHGAMAWRTTLPQGKSGETYRLRAKVCDSPAACHQSTSVTEDQGQPPLLASFRVA